MKVAIILNGISLKKSRFYKRILPALKSLCNPEVFETQSKNDAVQLAGKVVARGFDFLFAAGGDGTIHQVVNGMLRDHQPPSKLPVLGIIPLGGGNDFARSFGLSADQHILVRSLRDGLTLNIDVGEVTYLTRNDGHANGARNKRFFINVVDVGMGPEVVRKVTASGRALGSAIAYYQSILATFLSYKPLDLFASGDTWEWRKPVRTFAVANGRFYGNGLCIAPDARLDDRKFDVFACGNVSIIDFLLKSIPLKAGKKIRHPEISYLKSTEVDLDGDARLIIEADGEILGGLPASVRMSDVRLMLLNSGHG